MNSLITLLPIIKPIASLFNLDLRLVVAVIITESNGDTNAMKYEPHYKWLYNVEEIAIDLKTSTETIETQQKTSWGLFQLMGAIYHEKIGPYPVTDLLKPEINIYLGCKFLSEKAEKFGPNHLDIYAAYNAGSVRKTPTGKYYNHFNVQRFGRIYNRIQGQFPEQVL